MLTNLRAAQQADIRRNPTGIRFFGAQSDFQPMLARFSDLRGL
jgi:hypothetical protein